MIVKSETIEIKNSDDIVKVRHAVRSLSIELGFSLVNQTKFVTAASELARNTFGYGGGGVTLEMLNAGNKRGLRLIFKDNGPGIADIEQAMTDGFSTGKSLGLGLGGARRLVHDFAIASEPGKGTVVTVATWK